MFLDGISGIDKVNIVGTKEHGLRLGVVSITVCNVMAKDFASLLWEKHKSAFAEACTVRLGS
jgi:selenocysteine lyase/cysteine desulfurase